MIKADKLRFLTNMPYFMLFEGIQKAGYKGNRFYTSEFLGITNGGQFCYLGYHVNDEGEQEQSCKVFVSYDSSTDSITFGY